MVTTKPGQGIFGHWVVAMAVIVVVAALTIPQIDRYMVGLDTPNSLQMAGWVSDRAYSPLDVLEAVYTQTPYQGPLYFLLLNQWGYLVGNEIALARMLGIYCGLLSLAMAYRLGQDAISPIAGNFAIIIMASNAFYSFYLAHIRMYSLLVLLSTIVVWLYWRIAIMERDRRRSHYVALAGACAALISTHAFGLLLYIVLPLYHLLFVRRGRRWLAVAAAAIVGLALGSLHLIADFAQEIGFDHGLMLMWKPPDAESVDAVFAAWLDVTTNGGPVLLILAAAGAALVWREPRTRSHWRRCVLLFPLLLIAVCAMPVGVGVVWSHTTRYLLTGLPIAVLFQAAGLYALYRKRRLLATLIVLWVVTDLVFARSADWSLYMPGRLYSWYLPPWHLVSRTAEHAGVPAHVIAFKLSDSLMWQQPWGPVSLREQWFDSRDIELVWVGSVKWLRERARRYSDEGLSPWVVYQTSRIDNATVAGLEGAMAEQGYAACQRVSLPVSTEMARYSLVALDCLPARVLTSGRTAPVRYDFYGAALATDGSKLYFANGLTAESAVSTGQLSISHQLISDEWKNVGQLDLPAEPSGELRQFSMDVSEVAPGRYRLMAIVYNRDTGKTLDWQENSNEPQSMLFLQEVEIR